MENGMTEQQNDMSVEYDPVLGRGYLLINMAITVTPTRIRCMTPGNVDGAPTGSIGKMLLEKRWLMPTINKKIPPTAMDLD